MTMDDSQFDAIRAEIDKVIDGLPDKPFGIKMGFGLAGEFLVRGLLATTVVDMVLWKWEMRAYRDRVVYPDPMMEDYDFAVGQPSS